MKCVFSTNAEYGISLALALTIITLRDYQDIFESGGSAFHSIRLVKKNCWFILNNLYDPKILLSVW